MFEIIGLYLALGVAVMFVVMVRDEPAPIRTFWDGFDLTVYFTIGVLTWPAVLYQRGKTWR